MRYLAADEARGLLERYEVGDSTILGIANEAGDITAYVTRPDGSRGHSYGGPVYDPPEFRNVCDHVRCDDGHCMHEAGNWGWSCGHEFDMTADERAVATALAHQVGWMTAPDTDTRGTRCHST